MQLFLNVILLILFVTIPVYYLMAFSSTYYKRVYNNKSNIKYTGKVKSIGIYSAAIILAVATVLFAIYSYFNGINFLFTVVMAVLTIIVFSFISIISSKFFIFNNYMVLQNQAIEFKEIKNVFIAKSKKGDKVELKVLSKNDINTCTLDANDSKSLAKELRTLLPKNIKITEA